MTQPSSLPRLRPHARQGKAYYAELRAITKEIKYDVVRDFRAVSYRSHKITTADVCRLALKYELNLKAMFELLEGERELSCGTYDKILRGGIRPQAAMREVWENMQEERS